jgi:4-hydroxy-3-methylbut-2-enyl diphosphate reductase
MKSFDIPEFYKSGFINEIKKLRKDDDPKKKDTQPSFLDFGPIRFIIARHFGFCFGVENAIEISYQAIEENPGKRIFLLSQMIHNPVVNDDLYDRGIRFIMDPHGKMFIDWEELTKDDIVIIPAFGTTLEIEERLRSMEINVAKYNTTCPFVERVWKKSTKLGSENHSIIIHGKQMHEETKATFSHAAQNAPSIIIRDIKEAEILGKVIKGEYDADAFYSIFENRISKGFDPAKDLDKVGVVNQTTMLATETQEISDYIRSVYVDKYGEAESKAHFADTRDTLCYATNDNQEATKGLLEEDADLAIVVGGYNSSNTSHIVHLLEQKFPTYFINTEKEIESKDKIWHFNYEKQERVSTQGFIPSKEKLTIVLTSGASCPDSQVEKVIDKILSFFDNCRSKNEVLEMITSLN